METTNKARFLSPEWFAEQAKEPKYKAFESKAKELLGWFQTTYGIEKLKQLQGKELLDYMFYNDTEEKENLCYTLEMNPAVRDSFGSISGGSAFKFGLFYNRQRKCWMTGSPAKQMELSETQAIEIGTKIRDDLAAGAEEIRSFRTPEELSDYEELEKLVEKHIRLDTIWILKYYRMIFPSYFQSAYTEDHQKHILYALQIAPARSQFLRMGQIALFSRQCGISTEIMLKIFSDTVGWYKPIYRIGTGKNGTIFSDWLSEGYCALEYDEIGDARIYSDSKGKPDKEQIAEALLSKDSSYNQATASRKANGIISFLETASNETIVAAMNGQQLLGIGLITGDLDYDPESESYRNRRKTEWLFVPEKPVSLPVFEARQTSFVQLSNEQNMMALYSMLYHQDYADVYTDEHKTWLLMWNPNNWTWNNYEQWIKDVNSGIRRTISWTCSNTHVKIGDQVYLSVCGKGISRGIVGSGRAVSSPAMKPHWDSQRRSKGYEYRAIDVEFDKLVDYQSDSILSIETLQQSFPDQAWSSQSSGIEIRADYAKELSKLWYAVRRTGIQFKTGFQSAYSRNRIIFGAPGTGKSYLLNQEKDVLLADGGVFERVTFHPDYAYAHFAGTYKPVPCVDENGHQSITYKYVPGPFMRVYAKALQSGRSGSPLPCLLIIEEINRANTAAVFGDIFQLLDRDDDEVSEYGIQASEDMKQYLSETLGGKPDDYAEIKLPDNLFIWATMNSADQGVFPMDTAFKRRWDFTYLSINTGESRIAGKSVALGTGSFRRRIEWNQLRRAINDRLSSFKVNEDKLLGPYFLSGKVIPAEGQIDPEKFADAFKNKVLMYLYEDAARQKRASLFADDVDVSRYSSVCDAFDVKGVYVFCQEISSQFPPESGIMDGEQA